MYFRVFWMMSCFHIMAKHTDIRGSSNWGTRGRAWPFRLVCNTNRAYAQLLTRGSIGAKV